MFAHLIVMLRAYWWLVCLGELEVGRRVACSIEALTFWLAVVGDSALVLVQFPLLLLCLCRTDRLRNPAANIGPGRENVLRRWLKFSIWNCYVMGVLIWENLDLLGPVTGTLDTVAVGWTTLATLLTIGLEAKLPSSALIKLSEFDEN